MPAYTKAHDLVVGPLEELAGNPTGHPIQGIGRVHTGAIRYVVFRVQIEGIPSYDEEQVTLVVDNESAFARKVPIILGTPMLHCVINCMKESEMEKVPPEWENVCLGYEVHNQLYSHWANVEPDEPFPTNTGQDPMDLDEVVKLSKPMVVPAFGSTIVKGLTTETIIMGHCLHIMTQAPYPEDEANLPVRLYVLHNYCEMKDSSQSVYLVLRNGTSQLIHLSGGRLVRWVVTVNLVPKAEASPELMKELDLEENKPKEPKLTIPEQQAHLMEILEKNGDLTILEDWPEEDAKRAWWLLIEYHSIFSLDKNEMGCTDATEHVIKLTKSEPFKERFWHIAPPLIEEVREHIQEMLDGGAICPSNSPWCNAVVLVRKKDSTLQFCIDFRWPNDHMEKDSYPMPKMIDTMEMMLGSKLFSTMDLKAGFWQVKMAKDSQPYTAFTVSSLGIYEFLRMSLGLCNAPVTFQCLMQNCLGELDLTYTLIYLDNIIIFLDTEKEHVKWLAAVFEGFREHGLKLKPLKCHFFCKEINYLGHHVSTEGMKLGMDNMEGIAKMAPPKTVTGIRHFLGAPGFYWRFIKAYAKIAQPLNDLISDENSKLKNQPVKITPEPMEAFHLLKMKCMTAPVLVFTDFKQPFPAWNGCIKGWARHSAIPETKWWQIPPRRLCQ